ncbi:hypothetical protein EDI_326300 [Entamoeba dispar SAW760]|uniref:RRM domain-containing protein n=1 Tax=Entamoeba dispar (strain ATCC PRA-260 / SAW760) TaxID=370354 RepID=B0ER55_ENTDS|nr:uncharacterized protein EDI_326300 [Entamoeba dispar SAW760]EDR23008.1 hypothetical protein EDI_326300 [Entamoeba dispar SAW760]|eukprot:EDR23008.1 hypothetical protein EDI_326300 [Entamoeba dispar SAW760]
MEFHTNFPSHLIYTKLPCTPLSLTCNEECTEAYICDELGTLLIFDITNQKVLYRTQLPDGAIQLQISPKGEYLFVLCLNSARNRILYIYRVIRPFRLIEVDVIPNVFAIALLSDCSTSPIDFAVLCDDFESVIRYYYGNTANKSYEIVSQKRLPFKARYFISNSSYSQICAASLKELMVLSSNLITIKKEDLPYIVAGVAFSGNELFTLAGCSLKCLEDEKRDIFLPFGMPMVVQSHKIHIIAADRNKLYGIDTKSGKIYFATHLPDKVLIRSVHTNEKMSTFAIQLAGQPVLISIISTEAIRSRAGLLNPIELKETIKLVFSNIPETELFRAIAEAPVSVPTSSFSVYVGNFNEISADDVKEVFQQNFGGVIKVRPKTGHCFVDFKDDTSMRNALSKEKISVKGHDVFIKVAQKNANAKR